MHKCQHARAKEVLVHKQKGIYVKITNYLFPLGLNMICAVIADIHDEVNLRVVDSLEKQQPDFIFLVGDIVDRPSLCLLDSTVVFLQKCVSLAPTYYSFGNHERMLLESEIDRIKSVGVHVLDNTWIDLEDFSIGGLSTNARNNMSDEVRATFRSNTILRRKMSYFAKKRNLAADINAKLVHRHVKPEFDWIEDFLSQEKPKILLCHHPEYYDKYLKDINIDLIIAGHAHGGQIRLFGQGLFSPGQGYFPKYTSGIYDGKLVVSRGLSNTIKCIPRLFNPRELIYIHL